MTSLKFSKKNITPAGCLSLVLLICVVGIVFVVSTVIRIPTAPKTSSEVAGVYTLEHNLAKGQLELRSNGSFVQTMIIKSDSQKMVSEGAWTYRTDIYYGVRLGTIEIDDMLFVLNQAGESLPSHQMPRKGRYISPVWNFGGQVVIGEESEEVVVWRQKRSDAVIYDGDEKEAFGDIPGSGDKGG